MADVTSSPVMESRRTFREKGPSIFSWLISLPPLVFGMASHGTGFYMGVGLALGWLVLMAVAAYSQRTSAALLPFIFTAVMFFASLVLLPFKSAVFWVVSWSALAMVIMAAPKARRDHWRGSRDQAEGNPFSSGGPRHSHA